MTLRIVLALVAFVWLTDARAGFEDPVTANSTKQWTLWGYFYDPDGWAVYEDGLTLEQCNEDREHFHFRGDAMWKQAADPNLEAHRPVCLQAEEGPPT